LIEQNRDYEILDTIEEGKEIYGSQSFDQALLELYRAEKITEETVYEHATNPSDMKLKLRGIGSDDNGEKSSSDNKMVDIFDLKVEE